MARSSLILAQLSLVALVGMTSPIKAQNGYYYCPLKLMSQVANVYYYYCIHCDQNQMQCGYNWVSSGYHNLGSDCHCLDPIRFDSTNSAIRSANPVPNGGILRRALKRN